MEEMLSINVRQKKALNVSEQSPCLINEVNRRHNLKEIVDQIYETVMGNRGKVFKVRKVPQNLPTWKSVSVVAMKRPTPVGSFNL